MLKYLNKINIFFILQKKTFFLYDKLYFFYLRFYFKNFLNVKKKYFI